MTKKFRLLALVLLVAAFAGGGPGMVSAAPARQAGPQTWTVLAGGESEMEKTEYGMVGAWQHLKFYPDHLTINQGDTVVWKLNSAEFHEVVFPAPGAKSVPFIVPDSSNPQSLLFNPAAALPAGGSSYDGTAAAGSGNLSKEPPVVTEYKLTFTKAGTYNYLCPIHAGALPTGDAVGMTGNITVQAAGAALSKTPAQINADAQAAIAADAKEYAALDTTAKAVPPTEQGPNGTMIYRSNVGYDAPDAAYMRFSAADYTIHVGDTVAWKQTSANTPHTVTLASGGPEPDIALVQPQAGGPPKLMFNPAVLAPAGSSNYAGAGYYNSGLLSGTQDPAPGPRDYQLTFTKPGTYEYICTLHDKEGMTGHITVLAADNTPGMPTTGRMNDMPFGIALGAVALLLGGIVMRRKVANTAQR